MSLQSARTRLSGAHGLNAEEDLLHLARDRDSQVEAALGAMSIESPVLLRRQLRQGLSRQIDSGRMKRTEDRVPDLATVQGGSQRIEMPRCGGKWTPLSRPILAGNKLSFETRLSTLIILFFTKPTTGGGGGLQAAEHAGHQT
jgi:hypothetical protein